MTNESTRTLERALAAIVASTVALGLVAEVGYYRFGLPGSVASLFSLSEEKNVPTWVSTCLLFACSASLVAIGDRVAREDRASLAGFRALAAIFAFMSLDEAIEIHEHLGSLVPGRGLLYFGWVVPAGAIVLVLGLSFFRFVLRLPEPTRRRFVIAGAVYVGGALLMELPLGYYTERHGDDNLGYATIDFVEESLELVGASLFLVALERHRHALARGATP